MRVSRPDMRRTTAAVALGCAVLLAAPVPPASASTMRFLSLDEMARAADAVFTGEVMGVMSRMNARRSAIHTYVTIRVDDYWKGARGEVLTLRFLGGETDGFRLVVAGAPIFRAGEEVLVFAEGGAGRVPTVLGLGAGKFQVATDPESGERMLRRSLAGLRFADASGNPLGAAALRTIPRRAGLAEVREVVRRALAGTGPS